MPPASGGICGRLTWVASRVVALGAGLMAQGQGLSMWCLVFRFRGKGEGTSFDGAVLGAGLMVQGRGFSIWGSGFRVYRGTLLI